MLICLIKFIDLSFGGDIYIWGLQCEKGSFLTSYIPTNGSTATRGEDSLVIDGDDFNEFFDHTGAANQNYTGTLLSFMKFDDIKYILVSRFRSLMNNPFY